MNLDSFDLVASLQALPETDPIEIDGVQFGDTCNKECDHATASAQFLDTVCVVGSICG
ncbi:MAG: VenA family class IV lanthipeptide [Actinomycetota bacterium]|nr:VenA family class IV lanthipeptide [Actinomycetota bacterium]